jgi:hypothetical protein
MVRPRFLDGIFDGNERIPKDNSQIAWKWLLETGSAAVL